MLPGVCPGVWQNLRGQTWQAYGQAIVALHREGPPQEFRPRASRPASHHGQQVHILLIQQHRSSVAFFSNAAPAYMVDVGMGDHDLPNGEAMPLQAGKDFGNVVPGIDHHGFVGGLITNNGAIATQGANRKCL